jgi:hypothetical protein
LALFFLICLSDASRAWTVTGHTVVVIPHDGGGYDRQRDCEKGDCVVEKVVEFACKVEDARLSKVERAEALKFLIHLVGDLHVPLHAYAPGTPNNPWKGWREWQGPWVQIGERNSLLHSWWGWHFVAFPLNAL